MDNISWPHRTIKELRNDGMDQDDIAFLTGDVSPSPPAPTRVHYATSGCASPHVCARAVLDVGGHACACP
eukprot:2102240-Rhodomonas_salina.2